MKIAIILIAGLFLAACAPTSDTTINGSVINLEPVAFNNIIQDDNVFVIDTHIPEQDHITGTDAMIPFDELIDNLDRLPADKSTPIAVYCRSGSMSSKASADLKAMGYENVYNLLGGRNAYVAQGFT